MRLGALLFVFVAVLASVGNASIDDSLATSSELALGSTPRTGLRRAKQDRDLVIGGMLCRNDIPTRCICTLEDLLSAFDKASTDAKRITRIPLCYGSFFQLTKPINITGKAFSLKCIRPEQCTFRGRNSNLFVGAPLIARFIFLSFEFSEAVRGGAMHLTGGKTRFINMYVNGNEANETGGAIFVEGPETLFVYSGTIFTENYSNGTGGAISAANGATVRSIRSSYLDNGAETLGGALHLSGGASMSLSISLFSGNYATTANDIYVTSPNGTAVGNTTTIKATTTMDCSAVLRNTFCDGSDGMVTRGLLSNNCLARGIFRIDPRCALIGLGPSDDD
jgi:predicted outer membrane repeat protein